MKLSMAHHAYRYLFLALLFLGLALVVVVAVELKEVEGRTLYVDADADAGGNGSHTNPFLSIQDAVSASNEGDTVMVWDGVYHEHVVIDKTLSLIGNGSKTTTIGAGKLSEGISILADGVTLEGFTITNGSGIEVTSNNNTISNCQLSGNGAYGIFLSYSYYNTLSGNTCTNNGLAGISLSFSPLNTITNNTCTGNRYGLSLTAFYVYPARGEDLPSILGSSQNTLTSNSFSGNKQGIYIKESRVNIFTGNDISRNTIGISLGYRASGNTFTDNSITQNTVGVQLNLSDMNELQSNETSGNEEYGINGSSYIAAVDNWWGSDSGPHHPVKNPEGAGDNITDHVFFTPWTGMKISDTSTHFVDDDAPEGGDGTKLRPFRTMQDGIDHARSGDTVRVFAGEYHENIVVDKNLDLVGNSSADTRILGRQNYVVWIVADRVNFSGFSVTQDRKSRVVFWFNIGVMVASDHNRIFDVECTGNEKGISLSGDHNTLFNVTCSNNWGNGIYLSGSDNNTLRDINCLNNSEGIYLYLSNQNYLTRNTCSNNEGIGIYLGDSDENILTNNIVFNNRIGIYIYGSFLTNVIRYNSISNNSEFGLNGTYIEGYLINATHNWWGHSSGPNHPSNNSSGKGDRITDNILFDPWLKEPVEISEKREEEEDDDEGVEEDAGGGEEKEHFFSTSLPLDHYLSTLLLVVGVLSALVFSLYKFSESFKYKIWLFLLPLYTRLNEDRIEQDISQQNIRGRIYQYIKDVPGTNLSSIKADLKIGYGTVVYHLSVLGRERYLRSAAEGRKKLFWVKRDFPGLEALGLTDTQRHILEALEKFGPLSRTLLREKTGLVRTTLNSNVRRLLEMGKLEEEERQGKESLCSVKLY